MKRSLAISVILSLLLPMQIVVAASQFSDVSDSYIYDTGIQYLYDNDVIDGYPDGSFRPSGNINRAELTKIVIESLGITPEGGSCFPDVPESQWFNPYVCKAKELGWVEGYDDGTFQPGRLINRAEALKIVAVAEDWAASTPNQKPFVDTPTSQWYTPYVAYANDRNFLPFSSSFSPGQFTKRGEFSEIYYRVLYTRGQSLESFVELVEIGRAHV